VWHFTLTSKRCIFPPVLVVGLVAIKTILETDDSGEPSERYEKIYRIISRKSKWAVIPRYCLNAKIEMPRTVRASYPKSRWRGPSLAIESSCRTSSSIGNEGVFPFELLGTSPCSGLRLSVEISWATWSGCGWRYSWGTPGHILTRIRARSCDLGRASRKIVWDEKIVSILVRLIEVIPFKLFAGNSAIFRRKTALFSKSERIVVIMTNGVHVCISSEKYRKRR